MPTLDDWLTFHRNYVEVLSAVERAEYRYWSFFRPSRN